MEFLGDLAAGLAAADDQHRAGREISRVAVILDVDLKQVRRQRGRWDGAVGTLVGAGTEDHGPCHDLAGGGLQAEAAGGSRP